MTSDLLVVVDLVLDCRCKVALPEELARAAAEVAVAAVVDSAAAVVAESVAASGCNSQQLVTWQQSG